MHAVVAVHSPSSSYIATLKHTGIKLTNPSHLCQLQLTVRQLKSYYKRGWDRISMNNFSDSFPHHACLLTVTNKQLWWQPTNDTSNSHPTPFFIAWPNCVDPQRIFVLVRQQMWTCNSWYSHSWNSLNLNRSWLHDAPPFQTGQDGTWKLHLSKWLDRRWHILSLNQYTQFLTHTIMTCFRHR
jgi:hypothetical protein